jgi:hypothetical protein
MKISLQGLVLARISQKWTPVLRSEYAQIID